MRQTKSPKLDFQALFWIIAVFNSEKIINKQEFFVKKIVNLFSEYLIVLVLFRKYFRNQSIQI